MADSALVATIAVPQFLDLGFEVMRRRTKDGIRGVDREWSRWRQHVSTAPFATTPITDIKRRDVCEWLRVMLDKAALGPGEKRTLAKQTVARCQSLASAIFNEALDRDIIEVNPSLSAKIPKRPDERDTRDKWAFLTWAEQVLIYACEAIPYEDRLMIRIAADSGIRQGEMSHIERKHVFLDGPDPHIDVRIAGRDRRDKTKKVGTKSGKPRTVPLFGAGLAAWREWMALLDLYCPVNPEDLVFPTRRGTIRHSGKFFGRSDTLRSYYAIAGVQNRPYLHNHALRHTYATNLITGVYGRYWRLEEIQKVLGHSSITITQRYAHLGEDAIKKAARETEAAQAAHAALAVPLPTDTIRDLNALIVDDEAMVA